MTQTSNRFFDEIGRLMNDAAGAAQGVKREVDTVMRNQAERILRDLDVVKREEFEAVKDMARRLGTLGYYVMLPNMYYRAGVMEIGPINPDPNSPERKRMFELMSSLSIPLVMEDTKALLAYAEGQPAANTRIVGTVGYCMSGRYAVNAATHFPDRVKAAASVYGVQLATDQPDSPHLAAGKTKAELYFACAETDVYAPQEVIDKVTAGMKGTRNEVEIYPCTHHGFAFPKRPVYHRDAAERHWERLVSLYRRNLV